MPVLLSCRRKPGFMLLNPNFNFQQVNLGDWAGLIFAAIVGTFFAFLLDFRNIQRFGASTAVMVSYVIPVVSLLGGALLLDEQITLGMLWGMSLIVFGLWLIMRRQTAGLQDLKAHSLEKVS